MPRIPPFSPLSWLILPWTSNLADNIEAQRPAQLRQLIQAAPDVVDLRGFAGAAREVMGEGYLVHSGSNHVWLKRDGQAGRLAIIADRHNTRYRDWNAPAPASAPRYSD